MDADNRDEFRGVREKLDSVIGQVEGLIQRMAFQEAQQQLAETNSLYGHLRQLSRLDSSVHRTVLENRFHRIEDLRRSIQAGLARREAGKREDSNLAFKCNWNDAGYKGICSTQVYETNRRVPRSQCSRSNCRDYVGRPPPVDDCCYECDALRRFSFGAGWDHDDDGRPLRPRHIWNARRGKVALLTTIPHGQSNRVVVGAFQIVTVKDDPHRETYIHGDANTALDDMLRFHIPFWRYHKNPNKPDSQAWGQGLFRYVSDVAVLGILEAYREAQVDSGGDVTRVEALIHTLTAGRVESKDTVLD